MPICKCANVQMHKCANVQKGKLRLLHQEIIKAVGEEDFMRSPGVSSHA